MLIRDLHIHRFSPTVWNLSTNDKGEILLCYVLFPEHRINKECNKTSAAVLILSTVNADTQEKQQVIN